jgi:Aldehyde dehydrogenase family
MPDAGMDQAVDALIGAGYGSAGERGMAVSVAIPVSKTTADRLMEKLIPRVENLKIGTSINRSADYGPLVTREAYHNGPTTVQPASPARQKPRVGAGWGEIRGAFAPKTQHDYLQRVKNFTAYLGRSPDTASSEDVQRHQLHLTASSVGVTTVNRTERFFKVTLGRPDLVECTTSSASRVSCRWCSARRKWCACAASGLKRKAALSVAYGAGLCVSEAVAEDRRHRRQAHGHPGQVRQRPQRPLRDAVAASA